MLCLLPKNCLQGLVQSGLVGKCSMWRCSAERRRKGMKGP